MSVISVIYDGDAAEWLLIEACLLFTVCLFIW